MPLLAPSESLQSPGRAVKSDSCPVSILLPVHNAAPWLGRALRSLTRQTFTAFEVVAVDDASDDDTPDILERHARRDARIRVLRNAARQGLVAALNTGLATCRGRYLARVDADDLCHPHRLARQVAVLDSDPEVSVVGCWVESFPRRTLGEGYRRYDAWVNAILTPRDHHRERYVESTLPHPTAMMRTSELRALGGYADRDWPEDLDLWLRYHAAGKIFQKVPEVLYYWRDHPGRASRRDPRYARAAFLRCKAHHLARDPVLAGGGAVIWGAGPIGRQLGRLLREEGIRIAAHVDIDPAKVGHARRGAPVIAPGDLDRYEGVPVLAAVGSRGARDVIRKALLGMGREEGREFVVVA